MYYDYIIMLQTKIHSRSDETIRTQITLTRELKKLVDQQTSLTGESMSQYLRRAALLRLHLEQSEKTSLKELASKIIGSINLKTHPNWKSKASVQTWSRKIRENWQ